MKHTPILSVILLLTGTPFSLHAIPMFEEEKNLTVPEERMPADSRIVERSGSDLLQQDQSSQIENSAMDKTNISASTDSLVPITSAEAEGFQAAAEGSFEGHSVAAVIPKPLYRLGPNNVWEKQDLETKEWRPSPTLNSRFRDDMESSSLASDFSVSPWSSPEDLKPFTVFTQHYNRATSIDERKAAYQQKLRQEQIKNPSPASADRIFALQHLIAVLEKASDYQNKIVNHLHKNTSHENTSSSSSKTAALKHSYGLQAALAINDSPNKIERIADEIESNFQSLTSYQTALDVVQENINRYTPTEQQISENLESIRRNINFRSDLIKRFIEASAAYVTLLPPPYETMNQATQRAIGLLESNYIDKKLAIKYLESAGRFFRGDGEMTARWKAAQEAQKNEPRQQAIDLYLESADLARQAHIPANAAIINELNRARAFLSEAAEEAQKNEPRQQVIDLYLQSVDLYREAGEMYDAANLEPWGILHSAAEAVSRAAKELQENEPRQQVIHFYLQSADFYREATIAADPQIKRNLELAGTSLSQAGTLAKIDTESNKEAIDMLTQSADFYREAAAHSDVEGSQYLTVAGNILSKGVDYYSLSSDRMKKVADLFTQSANCYREAAATKSEDKIENLRMAGNYFSGAAIGIARKQRGADKASEEYIKIQQEIDEDIRSAREFKERANLL